MENGAAYSDVQNQLHIMLRKYVEENKRDEYRKVGGEIPYPVCMLFIGDRIREEAEEYIVPQMMRHWPSSFRRSRRECRETTSTMMRITRWRTALQN